MLASRSGSSSPPSFPFKATLRVSISTPKRISARDNLDFRRFLAVRNRSNRDLILVEGPKLIEEAIRSNLVLKAIAFTGPETESSWARVGAPQFRFTAPLMKSLSDVETNQGVVALAERPAATTDFLEKPDALVLILDGLQDPGNVGTLFRTAEAAGVSGILLTRGCADPLSPKAIRAAAGSAFRLPHRFDLVPEGLLALLPARMALVAAVAGPGSGSAFDASLPLPLALALGSEGSGLDPRIESASRTRVRVPVARGVESLNVAAAGAIVLFEIARRAGFLRQ